MAALSNVASGALVLLSLTATACTVDRLNFVGRPCSAATPCGGDTRCDPGLEVCVAVAGTADLGLSDSGAGDGDLPEGGAPASTFIESEDGWQWRHPLPQGNHLAGIWSDGTTAWAVGEAGTILRHAGGRWSAVATGALAVGDLVAVSGSGGTTWAVGRGVETGGVALVGDGAGWRVAHTAPAMLRAVVGVSPTEAWAVGDNGSALRFIDGGWTPQPTGQAQGSLYAIAAHRPQGARAKLWAVGDNGALVHHDGEGWLPFTPLAERLLGVWREPAAGLLWVVGNNSTLTTVSEAGASRTAIDSGIEGDLLAVAGAEGLGKAWVLGQRAVLLCDRDQSCVAQEELGQLSSGQLSNGQLSSGGIWTDGAQAGWIVGDNGALLRLDGTRWRSERTAETTAALHDVWIDPAGTIFAVGDEAVILRGDGKTWSREQASSEADLRAVWGDEATVWAVGEGVVLRRDDGRWIESSLQGIPASNLDLSAVWGHGGEVWAVGRESLSEGVILRFSAERGWRREQLGFTPRALLDIHGTSDKAIWAVGRRGEAIQNEGEGWSRQRADNLGDQFDLYAVEVTAEGGAWAAGSRATIIERQGDRWVQHALSQPLTSSKPTIRGLWLAPSGDLWAAGDSGLLLHKGPSETSWSAQQSGAAVRLHHLGGGADGAWVVGDRGAILHLPLGGS